MQVDNNFSVKEWILLSCIALFSIYIALFNLGYVTLWHDEGPNAIMAKTLLAVGSITGWDGRNFYGGLNGLALNSDLDFASFPPFPVFPSALGLWLFGDNFPELSLRFFHAFFLIPTLLLFFLALRLDFENRKRLCLIAFALFALSTQVLLFFRQGRYYGECIFFSLAMYYYYRLYWRDGKILYIFLVGLFFVLNFLSHFAIGASTALALATYHLFFFALKTTRKQWLEILIVGLVSSAICLFYLWRIGIFGEGENLEYSSDIYNKSWLERRFLLFYFYTRDLMALNWIPWFIVLWWLAFIFQELFHRKKKQTKKNKKKPITKVKGEESRLAIRWAFFAFLLLIFSVLVSVQPPSKQMMMDSRYMIAILPFLAFMTAFFIDQVWERISMYGGLVLIFILLSSNILAFPLIHSNMFTKKTFNLTLSSLFSEIHTPYSTAIAEARAYLNQHAQQEDTIHVTPWQENTILHYYLGDRLIFCCTLDKKSALPEKKVRELPVPAYVGDVKPVWQVMISNSTPMYQEEYELVFKGFLHYYPAQRPGLEYHAFSPLKFPEGTKGVLVITIYKRKDVIREG